MDATHETKCRPAYLARRSLAARAPSNASR